MCLTELFSYQEEESVLYNLTCTEQKIPYSNCLQLRIFLERYLNIEYFDTQIFEKIKKILNIRKILKYLSIFCDWQKKLQLNQS